MAAGINKVTLIGTLGRDPEIKYTNTGTAVATFSLATNESWTDKDGQKQERCEWHRIVAWSKLGEVCGQHLAKGRQVYIEGKIASRKYEDKQGIERTVTEIVARDVQFLGSKQDGGGRSPEQSAQSGAPRPQSAQTQQPQSSYRPQEDMGYGSGQDDIPF